MRAVTRQYQHISVPRKGRDAGGSWHVLAIVLVGSFMAVLDTTIVNVALPSIGQGVHASPAALEWIVSGAIIAGFTSMFFTLSILWQEGLGRSALDTGLLVVPFAVGSLLTAANSDRVSSRLGGSRTVLAGATAMLAGQGGLLLALHTGAPSLSGWLLAGPLVLAGLGNGLVIAPNQDFALSSVPRREAGTAGGALNAAQRIGAAIGIAVIGTVLSGSGSGSGGGGSSAAAKPQPRFVHTAQWAIAAELVLVAGALLCSLALPRKLGAERSSGIQ